MWTRCGPGAARERRSPRLSPIAGVAGDPLPGTMMNERPDQPLRIASDSTSPVWLAKGVLDGEREEVPPDLTAQVPALAADRAG